MKEKLIAFWERKERCIINAHRYFDRMIFFAQAFGGLDFAVANLNEEDSETELINLWENEWKARLEKKVYAEF